MTKVAALCNKELETNEVARGFKDQMEQFKGVVHLLTSLHDPALTLEAWIEISGIILVAEGASPAFHVTTDPLYTLEWILSNGVVE